MLQHEGTGYEFEDDTGNLHSSESTEIKTKFAIPKNLPTLSTVQETFKALEKAAEDMARQTETMFFQKADESTRSVGNVLDAGGRPFDPQMLLDMLDSVQVEFDENGKPELPTIVLHPDLFNSTRVSRVTSQQASSIESPTRTN